ncbi:flagellar protein [Rhodopseudomonas boonkerdii]|uniref:flagellin N-terminal helical domain-containing protein n=1 Tax=Rhodopseudomonas boonkerdii TaxID=475937 RepID=UPI001E2FFE6F|nr:flagellin [Rhodopseudomonas boonkerdii]UGV27495.1 flagellar protein [Rhodopseudomonas boonkerdii]
MSGITLSASVRQNLLSLQSTADLLSTTQNRLATGNKVNSALDNPTNFFTAQGLNNRASDINNLLDGIGNGVQILQAANTGITSLQKLVDSAKSIANQALQATSGYSTKSQFSATIAGATADNLLGTPDTAATLTGTATGTLAAASSLTTAAGGSFASGDTLVVNGTTIKITAAGAGTAASTTDPDGTINLNTTATTAATTDDLTAAIKTALGGGTAAATITGNQLTLTNSNATGSITLGGTALAKVGLTAGTTAATSSKAGQALTIGAIDGSAPQTITFGKGAGQVNTLDDLNKKLATSNLQASIDTAGKLTIQTTNDEASFDLSASGIISGTATGAGKLFGALNTSGPVADVNAQNTRSSLVAQYNTVIDQIKTTAADASFNGVNLLNGDTLALTFNETGKSKLSITGVTFDPAGLGLQSLTKGTDFLDNAATNKILTSLNNASSTLRSQASAFGSNLSVVQMRQDFSKQMINVLQTGASNLTLADTNEEAANSQALSTRQSIAVSALSLANQSQQGVLQLLR